MGVTASPSGYPPQTYSQAHTRLLSLTQLRNNKGILGDKASFIHYTQANAIIPLSQAQGAHKANPHKC